MEIFYSGTLIDAKIYENFWNIGLYILYILFCYLY